MERMFLRGPRMVLPRGWPIARKVACRERSERVAYGECSEGCDCVADIQCIDGSVEEGANDEEKRESKTMNQP